MSTLLQDLRFAARALARRPGFTLPVLFTLVLGIGANATIFSFLDGILLRPLSFEEPQRLVLLWSHNPTQDVEREQVSYPDFLDWRERGTRFEDLAAFGSWRMTLTGSGEPERISSLVVSPQFFEVLGVGALRGRTFLPEEAVEGRHRVVVMSHGLWQRRFGGDPEVVGGVLQLDEEPHTVVGVMPPEFRFPTRQVEFWTPMVFDPEEMPRSSRWLEVIGRLRPEADLEEARQELTAVARGLEEEHPDSNAGWSTDLAPLQEVMVREIRPALVFLQVIVVMVLVIACVNVANLMLARGATRRREVAMRATLGAGRSRLLFQVLAEGLLLSLAGGALGFLLAVHGVESLLAIVPAGVDSTNFSQVAGHAFPRIDEIHTNGRVLAFTLALSLGISLVFAWIGSAQIRRGTLREALSANGRSGLSRGSQQLRRALVVVQVALALLLLVGAGLLIRSFAALFQVDLGFEPRQALTLELSLGQLRASAQRIEFGRRLLEEVAAVPGVEAVGFSTTPPFTGEGWNLGFEIEGESEREPQDRPSALFQSVSPDYFRALEIPLRRGRLFDERDTGERPGVAIVNEALTARFWPGRDPIGERLLLGSGGEPVEVVGIVGDTLRSGLDTTAVPEIFTPYAQQPPWFLRLVVRSTGEPTALLVAVKQRIWTLAPDLPLRNVATFEQLVEDSLAQRRFSSSLVNLFALLALVLAALGVYGMISYFVAERRHELGVRMALGADRHRIFRLVVSRGMTLVLAGTVLGLLGSLYFTRLLAALLFGVEAFDLPTFGVVSALLFGVAFLASALPARRAIRLDPTAALRSE